MGRRPAATGTSAPAGGRFHRGPFPQGVRSPLSSSQWPRPPSLAPAGQFTLSPLSSVSLAVTSSASLVPAMLARTRSLRGSGSPHRAGRGGGPNAKTAPAPLHPKGTSAPTPWAWALLLSPPLGAWRGPHIETSKRLRSQARVEGQPPAGRHLGRRQMRRARWKRKNVRRVGLRQRGPPAAGGGRMAVLCGSQGRKRPALGETSSPGKSGIHPASLFAAAGPVVDGASATGR